MSFISIMLNQASQNKMHRAQINKEVAGNIEMEISLEQNLKQKSLHNSR